MKLLRSARFFVTLTSCLTFIFLNGCKDDNEDYPLIPNAVYVVSNAITGPGSTASTAITNSASGKVSVSPAVARVYVNTLKDFDITITYSLSGTAVAGVNYTVPLPTNVTIPAGKWFADIKIPVINTPLSGNKTIIISLNSATNDVQLGLGADRTYKTFTYTLTN